MMVLQVIGSGFGRTGTMSLKQALEQLAFGPCHHMEEVLVLLRHKPMGPRVSSPWSTARWAARQASYDSGDESSAHGRD
jgi:hypothetical protein